MANSAISYEIKTVKYNISSSEDIVCAASTIDDKYVGVKINENSSSCEGLDANWRKGAEHQPGYKYVLKEATIVKYNPPLILNKDGTFGRIMHLLIPGPLTPGSKVKLIFTKQSPWTKLLVRLTGNEQHVEHVNPGDFILYQFVLRSKEFYFTYFNDTMTQLESFQRQYTEGVKLKLTILVTQECFQTFIDEELVYNFSHVFDPSAARSLWIKSDTVTKVSIHSLEMDIFD